MPVFQNLQRMTPQSKVSLEQASAKPLSTTPSDNISIKKIQPTFEFVKLFDITPYNELLKQHRELQRKLVPEPCIESTFNTQSKKSRNSRRSDDSSSPKKSKSRYGSTKLKEYHEANCQECSRFDPATFSDCQDSDCSECSCSYCGDDDYDDREERKMSKKQYSSQKQLRSSSKKKQTPRKQANQTPKSVQQSVRKKEDTNQTQTNIKAVKSSQQQKIEPPKKSDRNVARSQVNSQQRTKAEEEKEKEIKRVQDKPKSNADPKQYPNVHPPLKVYDIEEILGRKPPDDSEEVRRKLERTRKQIAEANKYKEKFQAAMEIFKVVSSKVEQANKFFSSEVKNRFSLVEHSHPSEKEFVNEFAWRVNQSQLKEGKKKKEKLKEKITQMKEHSKNDRKHKCRYNHSKESSRYIDKQNKEHKSKLLEQRKHFLSKKKFEPQPYDEKLQERLSKYHRQVKAEKRQESQRKKSVRESQEKLKQETKKAFKEMHYKKFKPKHDFVVPDIIPDVNIEVQNLDSLL